MTSKMSNTAKVAKQLKDHAYLSQDNIQLNCMDLPSSMSTEDLCSESWFF